jgi:hypothetical protein
MEGERDRGRNKVRPRPTTPLGIFWSDDLVYGQRQILVCQRIAMRRSTAQHVSQRSAAQHIAQHSTHLLHVFSSSSQKHTCVVGVQGIGVGS